MPPKNPQPLVSRPGDGSTTRRWHAFEHDDQFAAYCDAIRANMTRLFGISDAEAEGRINRHWRGQRFVGDDDVAYHDDTLYWAKAIYYGPGVAWWKGEDGLGPAPFPPPDPSESPVAARAADAAADAAAAPAAAYCRACGYALRGLGGGGRCPECGRAFDLADRSTFARRPPRPWLRWWAWRVGLLALVMILAAGSVPGWCWWEWHREQAVIVAIRGAGGHVDVGRVELGGAARFLPARWAFLHDRAVDVRLVGDATAVLDRLDLGQLAHVQGLQAANGEVADAALAQLRGMTRLEGLILSGNPRLDGTGLRHLAGCRALIRLEIGETGLTDAGMAEVGKLTALTDLGIANTPVTDAGIGHLAGLAALQRLVLSGTGVTDAGLKPLRGLTNVRFLWLGGTKVTEQGRRDLQKALPNLTIY